MLFTLAPNFKKYSFSTTLLLRNVKVKLLTRQK